MPLGRSVGWRIAMLIAFALFAFIILGIIGLSRLHSVQQQLRIIDEVSINSVDYSRRMNAELIQMRLSVVRHKSAKTLPNKDKAEAELKEHGQKLISLIDDYEKLAISAEDKQKVEVLRPLVPAYLDAAKPILELSRRMDPNNPPPDADPRSAEIAKQVQDTVDNIVKVSRDDANAERNRAEDDYQSATTIIVTVIIIGGLMVLVLGLMLRHSILRSLKEAHDAVVEVARDLDFTRRAKVHGKDEFAETLSALNKLLDTLQKSFLSLGGSIKSLVNASDTVSRTADQIADSSALASEASSSMAAAVEQMTESINHVSDRAQQARDVATQSESIAGDSHVLIQKTVQQIESAVSTVNSAAGEVKQLQEQAANIGSVTQVIKDIADQTNLLALNAAIEAARAGETGRGFAVVADEVRKLAERTAQSTLEIEKMISTVQQGAVHTVNHIKQVVDGVNNSAESVKEAGDAIDRLRTGANETQDLVSQIAEAIREQASASTQIAQQVEKIAQLSDQNNITARGATDAAHALDSMAKTMHDTMARYKV